MTKSIRLEAPEGGWGIFVCFGLAISVICIFGSIPSFGLVFGDFLKSVGAETSALTFIMSSYFWTQSFSGLFANSLFKRFSVRMVGIAGGILFFIGSVMQIYVKTTVELTVAYSLVQGVAAGLILPSAYATFNRYFLKKRVMMMAFSKTLVGIGSMLYPFVVQKLKEFYGFRGCLLIIAAINSHVILGMLVMQPVEWHMKRVEVSYDEIEKDRSEPLLDAKESSSQNSLDFHRSYASLSLRNTSTVLSTASVKTQSQTLSMKASCWQFIVDFLDLSLLKNPMYFNIILGMSFALYSDFAFLALQPMYLFELNYTKMETAKIIAIGAAADLVSRVMLSLSSFFVTVPSRYIFLAGAFCIFITRFAFIVVYDFINMAIVTAILYILRAWIHTIWPLVIADNFSTERFASGYGLLMFLKGNINILVGPIVGYIRDRTKDYIITFHCLNFCVALCVFPWLIEIVYLKFRKQKK